MSSPALGLSFLICRMEPRVRFSRDQRSWVLHPLAQQSVGVGQVWVSRYLSCLGQDCSGSMPQFTHFENGEGNGV